MFSSQRKNSAPPFSRPERSGDKQRSSQRALFPVLRKQCPDLLNLLQDAKNNDRQNEAKSLEALVLACRQFAWHKVQQNCMAEFESLRRCYEVNGEDDVCGQCKNALGTCYKQTLSLECSKEIRSYLACMGRNRPSSECLGEERRLQECYQSTYSPESTSPDTRQLQQDVKQSLEKCSRRRSSGIRKDTKELSL